MRNKNIVILKELLVGEKNIVIIPHTSPDGDALGSCLALQHILNETGHKTNVISPNEPPYFLKWTPGCNKIIYYDKDKNLCLNKIKNADIIFTLDFNDLSRIGEMDDPVNSSKASIVMIDHHQNPKNYADVVFSDPNIGSTCELLYEIIVQLGYDKILNTITSTCLYLGIMTDTGSFQYSNVTSRTHEIVSKLVEKKINQFEIHNKVYNNSSISRLKVLGSALNNLTQIKELNTAYMYLKRGDLIKFDFKKGDSEGIVNYGLSLKNIIFSVIFIEDIENENKIKISFRSQGNFSCNEFAKKHFNGGGHINAAGGIDNSSLEKTINKFTNEIIQYKNKLSKK
jgi:phosphoesterase RecJ-like protein|tara:strand:+ start:6175 stop:7197 length:1023 start_codon:yes stop_codon:yes gene_type:complete